MAGIRSLFVFALVAVSIQRTFGFSIDSLSGGTSTFSVHTKISKNSGGKVTVTENGEEWATLLGPVGGIQYKLTSPVSSKLAIIIQQSEEHLGKRGSFFNSIINHDTSVLSKIAGNLNIALSIAGLKLNTLISDAGGLLNLAVKNNVICQTKANEVASEIIKSAMSDTINKIATLIDLLHFALKHNTLTEKQCLDLLLRAVKANVHEIQGEWSLELFLKEAVDARIIRASAAEKLLAHLPGSTKNNSSKTKTVFKSSHLLNAAVKDGLLSSAKASEVSSILLSSHSNSTIDKLIKLLQNGINLELLSENQAVRILVKGIDTDVHTHTQAEGASHWSLQTLLDDVVNDGTISADTAKILRSQIKSTGDVSTSKTKMLSKGKQLVDAAVKAGSLSSGEASQVTAAILSSAKSASCSDIENVIKLIMSGLKLNILSEDQSMDMFIEAVEADIHKSNSPSSRAVLSLLDDSVQSGTLPGNDAEKLKALIKPSGKVSKSRGKIAFKATNLLQTALNASLIRPATAAEISSILLSSESLVYKNVASFFKVLDAAMKQDILTENGAITLLIQAINTGFHKSKGASSWSLKDVLHIATFAGSISRDDAEKLESIQESLKKHQAKAEALKESNTQSGEPQVSKSSESSAESNSASAVSVSSSSEEES